MRKINHKNVFLNKRKTLLSVIVLSLILIFVSIPAFAAEGDTADGDYMYTVTVYAGAHGTVNGKAQDSIEVAPGTEVNLDNYFTAELTNPSGKYYIKGIRESGRDNNTVAKPVFDIDRDMDFVVAYGIEGDSVSYTVKYVELTEIKSNGDHVTKPLVVNGKTVEDKVYYGNAGDKPVVAYLYFDGYRPLYRNITGTLSKNDEENVYTFEYVPNPEPSKSSAIEPAQKKN